MFEHLSSAKSEIKSNTFNPDKRVDVTNSERSSYGTPRFDPDKRVDVSSAAKDSNGLSGAEKREVKAENGWSKGITEYIRSMAEASIYQAARLKEADVGMGKSLIRSDIDFNQQDSKERTNRQRMECGLAPLDKNGKPIELHHIGQDLNSPLAELSIGEHRGKGNDSILHDKTQPSKIDRNLFAMEKSIHWMERASEEG